MLPEFTADGLLPPGDYPLTFDELRQSFLVVGPVPVVPGWDAVWRRQLVDNLEVLVAQLWDQGLTEVYADGSFVQDKPRPGDIDAYFDCDPALLSTLAYSLNCLAPKAVWNWDRSSWKPDSRGKPQLPMWHRYNVDLWPHFGQAAGKDAFGNDLIFPSFFRQTRDGKPRGIIKIGAAP